MYSLSSETIILKCNYDHQGVLKTTILLYALTETFRDYVG